MIREYGDKETKTAREQASEFLSNAAKMRVDIKQAEKTNLLKARDEGLMSKDMPDKDLYDCTLKLS